MAKFKILTLGDSVMWGQGLLQAHKFAQLVADHFHALGKDVELTPLPHSGAVACLAATLPSRFDSYLQGELPRSFISISSQLELAKRTPGFAPFLDRNDGDLADWTATKAGLKQNIAGYQAAPPDLILVDGGINDLGGLQIAIPFDLNSPDPCGGGGAGAPGDTAARVMSDLAAVGGDLKSLNLAGYAWITDDKLRQLIDHFVYDRMRSLVGRLGQAFPNSKIMVTGYYPIFTAGSLPALKAHPGAAVLAAPRSHPDEMRAAMTLALHPAADGDRSANRAVEQSALWYDYSTRRLREVVDEANRLHGNRFALASPVFKDDNGAFAPHSFLWSFSGLIDELIESILEFFGAGVAAPAGVAAAAQAAAAAGLGLFGGKLQAMAFATGLNIGRQLATDEVIKARADAASAYYVRSQTGNADPETTFVNGLKTGFASIGHPNRDGAQAYFAAIAGVLP